MAEAKPLGLVGLGLAGQALAKRLLEGGQQVLGFDLHTPAREQAARLGVELAATAGAVATRADVILLSLPDSEVAGRVLADEQMGQHLRQGTLIIDTTTGCPSDASHHARRLAERQVHFVDVTLSGSSEEIAQGEATAMVGAAEDARLASVLPLIARRIFYLGSPGAGCLTKLVVNHVMGLNRAALAEGLALGERAGLEPGQLLQVLEESAAYSRVMDLKGRRMIERDYQPASRISQHLKDVRLVLRLGERVGAALPLEEQHLRLLEIAAALGLGDADNAALIEVFRRGADDGGNVI